jgi:hypothetical protein
MKKSILILSLIAVYYVSFMSCKKDSTPSCTAGSGGQVTLIASPKHHTKSIYNKTDHLDTAYVKFNATEFPGDNASLYDLVIAGEVGEDHVHIPGLKCGKYYVFMAGWDTTLIPPQRVKGGLGVNFSETTGEVAKDIPVTE